VIEWDDPHESVDVVKVAWPVALRLPEPRVLAPSMNVMAPAGVPAVDVTVAVNFTDCPYIEGFSEEVTVVVVVASATLTVCVRGAESLLL